MWKCPVCDRENEQPRCEHCGFDGSCDYEKYPTLGILSGTVASAAGRRAALEEPGTEERAFPGLEKVVYWLGWIYIPFHAVYLMQAELLPALLHGALILLALSMQHRLRKKGFTGQKTNTLFVFAMIPFVYVPFLAVAAFVLLGGTVIVALAMLVGLKTFQLGFIVLVLGILYHLLWNVGVTAVNEEIRKRNG